MYQQFWGLDRKPFDNRFHPSVYYASTQHQAAELKLRYVLESRLRAALLTGAAGVGKTMLLELLQSQYQGELILQQVPFPQLSPEQLLACVASRLSGTPVRAADDASDSLRRIEDALGDCRASDQHICLLVDECHAMPEASLETLRLLLNIDSGQNLTVVLSGQSRFRRTLQLMPQLEERLAVQLNLSRLSAEDTGSYVRHRLAAAGAQRPIFSEAALAELFQRTGGVPGRINRLADMALLVGFADDLPLLTPEHIGRVDQSLFATPWAA